MRFLYKMSLFTIPEIFGNGLDDLFMFKEFEKKDVKRKLHDASLHNVDFYELGKELEMDSDL